MSKPAQPPVHPKVRAGGVAGSLVTLLVWVLNAYVLPDGDTVPAEAAAAMVVVVSFAVGYFVPGEKA